MPGIGGRATADGAATADVLVGVRADEPDEQPATEPTNTQPTASATLIS
jgi:hypothetical protein